MHWNPAIGIPLLIVGLIVLVLIWLFGQPRKPGQVRRQPGSVSGSRREPTLGDPGPDVPDDADATGSPGAGEPVAARAPFQSSLLDTESDLPESDREARKPVPPRPIPPTRAPAPETPPGPDLSRSNIGLRPGRHPVEHIVTINVEAREDAWFQGADLIVAADKAGLDFGHKGIFHRLLDGKQELGPVFSVANMLKPGSFDLSRVSDLKTTGLSFFMTLPGPTSALDAWDAMLPTAQRMAELLGGMVLDDEHNALGRQRIAHIRDQLRAWDRRHQGGEASFDS